MIVSDFAVNRSTTVFVLIGLIVTAGLFSFNSLPREAMPEIQMSFVTVTTTYPGVSPGDMETLVTIPIERQLTGIPGIKETTSTSVEGVSAIMIEFDPSVSIEDALQKVRDKVEMAKSDLPEEADDSIINEVSTSGAPVMLVSLTGNVGTSVLTELAEDLEDKIEATPGVLEVDITGDVEREIQIIVDPGRVAEYSITLNDLVSLLQLENVNTPGGAMNLGKAKYLMRVPGEFSTPEELNSLVIRSGETGIIYLRDIAEIRDGFKEVRTLSRVDGLPAVTLNIKKRSGESVITMTENVNRVIARARPGLPEGVEITVTMDQSTEIRESVDELVNNILSGLVLVFGIVCIFMGLANGFFVALAIPISFLITFSAFSLLGITLNTMVLFSLSLSLGMLVDNGIVVVENIYRHAQSGLSRFEAAKKGTAEVAMPVIASTVTTIAAFSPLFFWPSIMGQMMKSLPQTITIILLASLFVGLVVNPALASVFMNTRKLKRRGKSSIGERGIIRYYASVLKLALRWRLATITLACTSLVVIVAIYMADFRVIFLPDTEPFSAEIDVMAAEGTGLETTDEIVRKIEAVLQPYRDQVQFIVANVGRGGSGGGRMGMGGGGNPGGSSHRGSVTIHFLPYGKYETPPTVILEAIRPELEKIVGAELRITKQMHRPPVGPALNLEITGDEFAVLSRTAQDIRRAIANVPGLVDLRDDYDKGKPEIRVEVNRAKAWLMGLSTQTIGLTIRAAVEGRKAGEYREGDKEYDVVVRFPREYQENLSNIESMNFMNIRGEPIPFSAVASIEEGAGLGTIKHIDRKRTLTVSGYAEGRPATDITKDVARLLEDVILPSGYVVSFTGEFEDMNDTSNFLGLAFVIGLFLIAMVLITQFNSIIQPLIILSSVILSLGGVFLGLTVFNMPFGALMTGLGCISLMGIVVNNAIVLIDFINQERRRGMPINEAIIRAGIIRFRPVTLTAITTILGLIPMALGTSFDFRNFTWTVGGQSSQFWGSMTVAICFGLAFATMLTLIVLPVLYSLCTREEVKNEAAAQNETPDILTAAAVTD